MTSDWEAKFTSPSGESWEARFTATPAGPTGRERMRAGIVGAAQGVGSNFTEDAVARARALYRKSQGEDYGKALEEELGKLRGEEKSLSEKAPVPYYGGQVAGSLLQAALVPGGRGGGGLAERALRGGMAGAAGGALSGFGAGEGGATDRLQGSAIGTAIGGPLGAVAGAVIPPVVAAAKPVVRRVADALGLRGPQSAARSSLARAVGEEGIDTVEDRIAQANAYGHRNMTVMDYSQRASDLGRDVTAAPNPSQTAVRNFLAERQEGIEVPGFGTVGGQRNRLIEQMTELSGVGRAREVPTVAALEKRQEQVAGPLFRQAERFNVAGNPRLRAAWQELLQTPVAREVRRRIAHRWGFRHPNQPMPNLDDPNVVPDFRALKMAKEALDATINRLRTDNEGAMAGDVISFRDKFRDALRGENPVYGRALDAFSGPAALKDAAEAGERILGLNAEEIAQELAKLGTASERHAYKIGAMSKLADEAGRKTEGPMTDFAAKMRSDQYRSRMYALLPDEEARTRWDIATGVERQKSRTAAIPGGSQTQPRGEVAKEMEEGVMPVPGGDGVPRPYDAAKRMAVAPFRRARDAMVRQKRGVIGRDLIRTDADALQLLEELRAVQNPPPPRVAGGTRAGLAGGGLSLDLLAMLSDEQRRRLGLPSGGPTP